MEIRTYVSVCCKDSIPLFLRKKMQIEQQLKVEIEDGRRADSLIL